MPPKKAKLKLEIELIPGHSWGKSLAQELPKQDWDKLRKMCYRRFNWTCCICEDYGIQVHCHEIWKFDDRRKIQTLIELACLCPAYHNIKHWGRTVASVLEGKLTTEYKRALIDHFCKVNKCTLKDFENHVLDVGHKNWKRSKWHYKIDFSKVKSIIEEMQKVLDLRKA